jgi:hypothetical protein
MKLPNQIYNLATLLLYFIGKLTKSARYKRTQLLLQRLSEADCDIEEAERLQFSQFLNRHLVKVFNYPFVAQYDTMFPKVFFDSKNGLKYVITPENYRLYFSRNMSSTRISKVYKSLLTEQDPQSPHCYTFSGEPEQNSVLADIGAAEGNFSLKYIERFSKVYLFECNEDWIEALEATFAAWKDKVVIIKALVADNDAGDFISLDKYFSDKQKPTLLKMDVEGYEQQVLTGASNLINEYHPNLLVCTYHKKGDDAKFSELLQNKQYSVNFAKGYMAFQNDFRKGLIFAQYKTML